MKLQAVVNLLNQVAGLPFGKMQLYFHFNFFSGKQRNLRDSLYSMLVTHMFVTSV